MQDFVTLSRTHADFREYLLGGTDQNNIPLPVRSLYVNQAHEEVTFQLTPLTEIDRPKWPVILTKIFRLDVLALTFVPAIVTVFSLWAHIKNILELFFALGTLLFLHAAVFCRNDFVDHMHGIDRINEKSGSQIIQRGWLRARTVQTLYRLLFVGAFLLALPILWSQPELIVLAIGVWVLGATGYSHLRWGGVHWLFGDLVVWCCLGPFLTFGFSWLITGQIHFEAFLFGFYFGLLAVLYVEIRHMISLVVDYEAKLMTLPVRLGFDRAKLAVVFLVFLIAAFFVIIMTLRYPDARSLLGLPIVGYLAFLAKRIFALKSPLSSALYVLPQSLLIFYLISGLFFISLFIL